MKENRPKPINSLSGLKVICLFFIFWWHLPVLRTLIDSGVRACEFLFVVSGFLVGYNAFNKVVTASLVDSLKYIGKKLIYFYPLHVLTMLFVWIFIYTPPRLTGENLFIACINLLLLQAWGSTENVYFSFNGPSWFLSALLFCYLLSPYLLKMTGKKVKHSLILFVGVFAVHATFEAIVVNNPETLYWIYPHTFPVFRLLEFFMGMLLTPLFMWCRNHISLTKNKLLMTLGETITLGYTLFLIIIYNTTWSRSIYTLVMCVVVFVFAFDTGWVSRILSSKPFEWFSKIQFEFYLLHSPIIKLLYPKNNNIFSTNRQAVFYIFVIIIVMSVIYKKIFRPKFAKYLEKLYNLISLRLNATLTI